MQIFFKYLTTPLEIRYAVNDNVYLILGLKVGFLLNAKTKGDLIFDGDIDKTNDSYNLNPKFDYGVILGLS